MNRQLNLELKNYNFLENLTIGYLVDAVDQGKWKVSRVVNIKSYGHRHVISLHFDGYPDKWDEDFQLPASSKLAPFRRFTMPYTGPEGYSRLEIQRLPPNMDFSGPLKDLSKLSFKKQLKCQFINQNLRGELFLLIDNILTRKTILSKQIHASVVELMKVYIKGTISLLNYSLEKINEINKENISDPNIIYVSPVYAAIYALSEFMYNINSLVNGKEKRVKFHTVNDIYVSSEESIKGFREFFIENKGVELCQAVMDYQNPPYKSFPWSIKKQILITLSNLIEGYSFPKVIDNREILELLDYLPYISSKNTSYTSQVTDKKHIELVMGLVVMGNFEGKLRGLNQLKKLTQRISTRNQILVQSIKQSKILYQMTDNSTFNKQLFRRSISLFEYADKKGLLTNQILNRIINLQKDKHELELKAFYQTLVNFAKFLGQEKCMEFFHSFQKFPVDQYQIILLKDYTLKAIDQHPYFRKQYMEKNAEFAVSYFWKIIENSGQYQQKIIDKVIQSFSVLIANIYYKHQIEKYVKSAINGIKQRRNVDSYLKIIHNSLKINKKFANMIESLDEEANLVDSVVKSILETKSISENAIKNAFQFLQEVNHYVRKKMTVDHIKMLWKIQQCRTYLLKFMRKHRPSRNHQKSTQKILSKQLNDTQIKQIIQKIFLSTEMMNHYSKATITQQLFQTADQLIVAYNNSKKSIEYNYKHTIRCIKPDQLYGMNFYMNTIMNAKQQDKQFIRKAMKRLIQFYLRPLSKKYFSNNANSEKMASWMNCIDLLAKLNYRMYQGFQVFFEEVQGRMKSLNIFEDSSVNLLVLLKGKNIKKNVYLPRYTSLWKLRQVIGQQFSLGKTNFEMFFPTRNLTTDMQKQQDFSLALIQLPKDPSAPAIVISSSKQMHPHYVSIDNFKTQFSNNYGEKLYDSLQTLPNQLEYLAPKIIKLLISVPPIKNLQKKIQKIDVTNGWEDILSINNRYKLQYQLFLMNSMKGMDWATNFIKKKGIEHIVKILITRTKPGAKFRPYDYKVFTSLLKIFNEMLKFYKMTKSPLPFTEQFVIQIFKPQSESINKEILEYFYHLIFVLREIANYQDMKIPKIFENPVMTAVLQLLLFGSSDSEASKRFPNTLIAICQKGKCQGQLLFNMQGFLTINFLMKNMYNCSQFFNTLVQLLNKSYLSQGLFQKIKDFISVAKKSNLFDEPDKTNELLLGWIKILKVFSLWEVSENIKPKLLAENYQIFSEYIIMEGLFSKQPKFKTQESRNQAYEVLTTIPCQKLIFKNMTQIIYQMVSKSSWRRQYQWFVRCFQKRQNTQKVGLKNLAATCYINSLLQQLFFINKFSQPLLSLDPQKVTHQQNILYELQKIFSHLKYSDNTTYTTQSLCRTFILDGQPIDPRIQTDVDQFFHSLMDKVQRNLIQIGNKQIIDDVFRGQYSNLIVGQQCPHKSQRFEHFLSMRLQIINKKSLNEALQQFIKGEVLEGDNAYFCEKCDKKVKALKRVCVKNLPQVLILTLKRFQFDFDKMEKFKLNTYCEFPTELDMFPYMREALYKDEQKMKPQDYHYTLKGTIIHCGLSEAGHYTSYIRTKQKQWKYFDDDRISDFNIEQLANQCFGGIEQNIYSDDSQKIKNSYILIYEKNKLQKQAKNNIAPHPHIIEQVKNENQRNQDIKLLFEDGLIRFFSQNYQKMPNTYLIYLHLVILRSQYRNRELIQAYEKCLDIFTDKGLCSWYLNQFSDAIIKQFLIYSHFDVSSFVASLVICCLKNTNNVDFIRRCMKCLDKKNMYPLNKIFQEAINADQCYQKALGQFSFADKVYRIIRQGKNPPTNNISKIPDIQSQFGHPADTFTEKRDFRSNMQLLLAIEKFKIGNMKIEDVDILAFRATKINMQISLAKIVGIKFRDLEGFMAIQKSFIVPTLLQVQPKIEEQHVFVFVLVLIREYCLIKDQFTNQRIKALAEQYVLAIKQSLQGYKAMRYLLQSLFNISFQNPYFHSQIAQILSPQKKLQKAIRDWIKESDKAYYTVKQKHLGYWRQPNTKFYYVPQNQLASIERDEKIIPQQYLNLFNQLLDKHKNQSYINKWVYDGFYKGDIVMDNQGYGNKYEVLCRMGLLLQVRDCEDGGVKFVGVSDVVFVGRNL